MRIVLGTLIGLSLFLGGCQEKKVDEHNEKMSLDQVPPKIRQAIKTESDTPVESINRHEVNGNVVYEAVGTTGGKTYDLELDSEGRLLRRSERPKAD